MAEPACASGLGSPTRHGMRVPTRQHSPERTLSPPVAANGQLQILKENQEESREKRAEREQESHPAAHFARPAPPVH